MSDIVTKFRIDYVFDLATIPLPTSLKYPNFTVKTNVGIATTFAELARLNQIERLIHLSSSETYGSASYIPMNEEHPSNPSTPYAASKTAADAIILSYRETFGIDALLLRPFNNFGPRQNPGTYAGIIPIVIQKIKEKKPIIIYGDGQQTRDFMYVEDTARYILEVAECENVVGPVNVATGKETSINDLVHQMLAVMGIENHEVRYEDRRPGDVYRHCADTSKLEMIIHRKPASISQDQLLKTIEWYFNNA
jgi:UDP-glucose 4-epimerase